MVASYSAAKEGAEVQGAAGQLGLLSLASMDEENESAEARQCLQALKEGKRCAIQPLKPFGLGCLGWVCTGDQGGITLSGTRCGPNDVGSIICFERGARCSLEYANL